jgi:hypothetical protein
VVNACLPVGEMRASRNILLISATARPDGRIQNSRFKIPDQTFVARRKEFGE